MPNEKKVFSSTDAAPVVLYAKTSPSSELAYPLTGDEDGNLNVVVSGKYIPRWNSQVIDTSDPNDIIITYKMNGTTVATEEIVIVGTTTTITLS
jgi:hypothetical protein